MSEEAFIAENPLEELLIKAYEGKASIADLVICILNADVWLLSSTLVSEDETGFSPLVFDKKDEVLMAVFSSLARSYKFQHKAKHSIRLTGQQLLRRVPSQYGLVFNPGWRIGFEIPASGVLEIQRDWRD